MYSCILKRLVIIWKFEYVMTFKYLISLEYLCTMHCFIYLCHTHITIKHLLCKMFSCVFQGIKKSCAFLLEVEVH